LIKYKDFAPQVTKRSLFKGVTEVDSFPMVVSAANQWIENSSVQVINIETVVLPNSSPGTDYGMYITSGGYRANYWYQCVRVWYRE